MARLLDNYIYGKSIKAYNELAAPGKQQHFRSLAALVSKDPVVRELGKVRILEIGAASTVDVSYFPPNTLLTTVDQNPEFEQGVKEEILKNPGPELQCYVIVPGEDMRPIADDSMDAVVTTMALSRADNAKNMLAEIYRVLAPGGKYYFWEPIEFESDEAPTSPTSPRTPLSPRSPAVQDVSGTSPANPFVFQRQMSTELVNHARTEVREPQEDHGTLSNLKVLVNVALRRPRKNSVTIDEHNAREQSNVERLIRAAGFGNVVCENFLLHDPSDEELQKKTWMEKKMALSVPKHWHLKGIAEKPEVVEAVEEAPES